MKNTFSYSTDALKRMPPRPEDSNKGSFGRVLCVCGSYGMAGAAFLAAKAALRTGAGLCEILTPSENVSVLQTLIPEAIVTAYDRECPSQDIIDGAIFRATAIVCGCGLGVSAASRAVVSRILRQSSVPTVIDADGLNIISRNPSLLKYAKEKVITPHPTEMSRLTGIEKEVITSAPLDVCRKFAEKHQLVCVLKGHNTAVSDGGDKIYVNNTGNSGMATAGSGDVLAGIIGGIMAQNSNKKLSTLDVATLGVYIHGMAGDIAAEKMGKYSLIASDIIEALPLVLR